jgi:hypothetical protein
MFWNRWHLTWLGVCFVAATAGAFTLLFWLIVEGPPRPYYGPIGLVQFLLAFYTLPLVGVYLAGIAVGLTVRRLFRLLPRAGTGARWSMRRLATVKR